MRAAADISGRAHAKVVDVGLWVIFFDTDCTSIFVRRCGLRGQEFLKLPLQHILNTSVPCLVLNDWHMFLSLLQGAF